MIRRLFVVIYCLFLISCHSRQPAVDPSSSANNGDPLIDVGITKAIAADGKLWLLGATDNELGIRDASGLVSLGLEDNIRQVHFQSGVIDIIKSGGSLWALRTAAQDQRFILSVWRKSSFEDFPKITTPEPGSTSPDAPLGTLLEGYRGLLSSAAVFSLVADMRFGFTGAASVAVSRSGRTAYSGIDHGEWGGDLYGIRLRGPADEPVGADYQFQNLNVTALIPDPVNEQCVIAAVGLVHMFTSQGELLRVCDSHLTVLTKIPIPASLWRPKPPFQMTEAFYSLAPSGRGFWAATQRGIYHFDAAGHNDEKYRFPTLESVAGIHLSRALPGIIVVRSDVHCTDSTCGYTPLLVPLDNDP